MRGNKPPCPGINFFFLIISRLLLLFLPSNIASTVLPCPDQIKFPCSCFSLPSQKLAIVCSGARSLDHLLDGLQPFQGWPEPIGLLRLEDTPIPLLYLDPLGLLASLPVHRLVLRNNSLANFLLPPSPHPFSSSDGSTMAILDTLEHLEISQNEIAHFADCPALAAFRNLRALSLSANRLGQLPAHTFLRFHSRRTLQQLDLSANWLSERSLPPGAFLGLESLQKLSLDKNQLSKMPTEALAQVADSLEELLLSANQIDQIETDELPPLPRLKTLGLDVNQISWLNGELFQSVPSLWYLYLGQNQFPAIPPAMLAFLPELKVLAMGGNPIDRLEAETFQLAPTLLRLELSDCRIRQIHTHTFGPMPRLQFLHLRGNRLDRIQRELFAGQFPFLVSLDLAQNGIIHLDDLALAGLGQLQSLDLSANRISSLPPNLFRDTFEQEEASPNVQMLNLDANPIDCGTEMDWLLALRGRVRVKGSCGRPTDMRGVDLAKLATSKMEAERRMKTGTRLSMWPSTIAGMSSDEMETTTITTVPITKTTSTMAMAQMERIGTEWPNLLGKKMANGNGKGTTIGFGHLAMGTSSVPSNEEERRERESMAAMLLLVVVVASIGFLLAFLLAIRFLLHRHNFPMENGAIPNGWLRSKLFGPSKSFTPPSSRSSPTHQLSPALLTTLNYLHTIGTTKSPPHKMARSSIFYTEEQGGGGGGRRVAIEERRDRRGIQRELFWF